jgi:signal transduction histidine kinase
MRARRWVTWLIFGICTLAVLNALALVSMQVLQLEERERGARAEAQFQELIRLAGWRMDGEVLPLLSQESNRQYFEYLSFYPENRAYGRMWQDVGPSEVLVASPLLEGGGAYIKLYFQYQPDGTLTSPQVPTGERLELAVPRLLDREFLVLASERLGELSSMIAGGMVFAVASRPGPPVASEGQAFSQQRTAQEFYARQQAAQAASTLAERARKGVPEPSKSEEDDGYRADGRGDRSGAAAEVRQGMFSPQWIRNPATGEPELLLHRRVEYGGSWVEQGFWIDWPALRRRLLAVVEDLLPDADLAPASPSAGAGSQALHRMASIPVLLEPGKAAVASDEPFSPTRVSLGVTWLAVLTAIGAIGIVLRKSMELGDRRGRFVSAVTHELRTPLTTFCLYTEMLAGGMVSDEEAKRGYLATLKGESRRLAGIVENVLEYARLGGKKPPPAGPPIMARDLVSRIQPALERCAERCNMKLVVEGSPDPSLRITADPQTVERILLNLVDNACKYAADASDRRVHLVAGSFGRGGRAFIELRVRDHGPGIPAPESKRIFRPFQQGGGARSTRSGLGLGLALSRALARELGGDLVLANPGAPGAEFILSLPA